MAGNNMNVLPSRVDKSMDQINTSDNEYNPTNNNDLMNRINSLESKINNIKTSENTNINNTAPTTHTHSNPKSVFPLKTISRPPGFSLFSKPQYKPQPKPQPEVVDLIDSDDEILPDANNDNNKQSIQPLTAQTTGKRDRNDDSEVVIDLTNDESQNNSFEIVKKVKTDSPSFQSTHSSSSQQFQNQQSQPQAKRDDVNSVEILELIFERNVFPNIDRTQQTYARVCITSLKEYRNKYTNYYRSSNEQWKALEAKINSLKGRTLSESENEKLQQYHSNAKFTWEMKNLYSRYREYYSDSLKSILSVNSRCDFKKYHESLVETVRKLEEQAVTMPKKLMEQAAMKSMKFGEQNEQQHYNQQQLSGSTATYRLQKSASSAALHSSSLRFTPAANFAHRSESMSQLNNSWNMARTNNFFQNRFPGINNLNNNAGSIINNTSSKSHHSLFGSSQSSYYYQPRAESTPVTSVDKKELAKLLNSININDDISPEDRKGTPESLSIILLEHQKIGLTWLLNKEKTLMGGILADDMGLGKTIQMISLIVSNKSTDPDCKTTLVLAPVALLKQWEKEFDSRVKPEAGLKVCVYHGTNRKNKTFDELKKFDVVLTTYGIIGKEHKEHFPSEEQKQRAKVSTAGSSPFFQPNTQWYRVVLDEAQSIKNKNTVCAKACCALNTTYRWCLSGTPMQNNVLELQSLIKFLRIQPYADERKFSADISKPLEKYTAGRSSSCTNAMKKLQAILKAIMLRRTKKTLIDGKPILQLPAKDVLVETYELCEDEREYYSHLENGAIQQMNRYLNENSIAKNYSNILVMLLRLRQACCHPKIVERALLMKQQATLSARSGNGAVEQARKLNRNVVERIRAQAAFTCPLCLDAIDRPDVVLFAPCGHHICSDCCEVFQQNRDDINSGYRCPSCSVSVQEKSMFDYIVFEWVHVKQLTDGAIRQMRQNYRETSLADKMNRQKAMSDGFGKENGVKNEKENEDYSSRSSSSSSSSSGSSNIPNRVKSESVKPEESSNETEKEDVVMKTESDDNTTIKPEIKVNPMNKYSSRSVTSSSSTNDASVADTIQVDNLLGPVVPHEDLSPCFPRGWVSSTKIDECMQVIRKVHSEYPGEKILVFSQFMSMLDFVEVALELEKKKKEKSEVKNEDENSGDETMGSGSFRYGRYDGSMSSVKRNDTVTAFFDDPEFSVLLISLKAGNVGLTLTAASHIIILDPFWNPFVEEQAMDRVHRIGQIRHVYIHRLFIKDSVEDRILALQEKKRSVIDAALDEKEIRNTSRLDQNELLYLFGLDARGQKTNGLSVPE